MTITSDGTPSLFASLLNITTDGLTGVPATAGVTTGVITPGVVVHVVSGVVVQGVVGTASSVSQLVVVFSSSSQSHSSVVVVSGHAVAVLIGPQGSVTI